MTSPESEPIAQVLSLYKVPQISHGSQDPKFSDHFHFPSFLRTVPSSSHQPSMLCQLLQHFNWTWVGVVSFGSDAAQLEIVLKKELGQTGSCLALSKTIYDPYSRLEMSAAARDIGNSRASVFLCHCYNIHFKLLVSALQAQNVTSKTWILTTSLAVIPEMFTKEALQLLNGSLDLRIHSEKISGFDHFLTTVSPAAYPNSRLVKVLWQNLFDCVWPGLEKTDGKNTPQLCTGVEQMDASHLLLFDLENWAATYQAYIAARAFITAYHNMISCIRDKGPFTHGRCATTKDFQQWQVHHYLKDINFTTSSDEIFFKNGEIPATFDIMNLQILPNGSYRAVKVGVVRSRPQLRKELLIHDNAIRWAGGLAQVPRSTCSESCLPGYRKLPLQGKPHCCYSCLQCPHGQFASGTDSATCWECLPGQWPNEQQDRCIPTIFDFLSYTEALGVVLATCSSLFFLLSLSVLGIFIQHHHTPVVKANNRKLSYLLLTSLALCFLCPLMYLGHPSQLTCSFRQAAFGLVFAICLSATLAKTVTVVMAFGASKPGSCLHKWVGYKLPGAITLGCSLVQAAVCVCWITVCPPFPSQNPLHGGPLVTLECDKGSVEFFYTMLGYLGFLATISLGVAFPARRLPTAFNEAQHIAISMLVFTFVWVSFVPSYLSATGKYTVAVEIFAILASGAGLLACLFFPKCYIIILHPKKNNRDHLMGRQLPRKGDFAYAP
ncbi:extracellular calcium-sensing receptor-like [Lacerta agilis]|uniref:extracellular calcium-sensing receptor-like n=1 Tax=Lacerta agilis TaxID=80427 RepID=UPI00141A15AA|nr:extracellular calcium-sensing receptor-like [Lacerta agilis]